MACGQRPDHPGTNGFPHGWVLVSGKVSRTILDGSARLLAETDEGEVSIDVPVSVMGTVFELVKLPAGIRRLVWQPSSSVGTFRHTPLRVRKIGVAERYWLMTRRVAFMLWKQPAERKKKVGLGWLMACIDLAGQYRACGKLRAYVHATPLGEWIDRYSELTDADRKLMYLAMPLAQYLLGKVWRK